MSRWNQSPALFTAHCYSVTQLFAKPPAEQMQLLQKRQFGDH
jgi:hypothetical protein